MTSKAKLRRSLRRKLLPGVMLHFSQTKAGQRSTPNQVRAAAKQLLMQMTSSARKADPTEAYLAVGA